MWSFASHKFYDIADFVKWNVKAKRANLGIRFWRQFKKENINLSLLEGGQWVWAPALIQLRFSTRTVNIRKGGWKLTDFCFMFFFCCCYFFFSCFVFLKTYGLVLNWPPLEVLHLGRLPKGSSVLVKWINGMDCLFNNPTQFSLVCRNKLVNANSSFLFANPLFRSDSFLSHVVRRDYLNAF